MIARRALLGAALAAATWSSTSRADSADQRAAAQVLFDQGKALVERGDFPDACPKFAESLRLDPGLGTMLWLADCFENNGQTASAWVQFKEAAAAAALQRDGREKIARERADSLKPRLSYVSIVVPKGAAVQGLEVQRDGVLVGVAEWGVPVPLDPGAHAIAATAPGRRPWTTKVQVSSQPGTLPVTIPVLEAAPQATESAGERPSSVPMGERPERGGTQRAIGLVAGAVGVLGVGVGAFFGLRAKSVYDDSNKNGHCLPDNQCDGTGKDDRSSAKSMAAVSTIAFGAGLAALAGGVVLYVTAPKDARQVGLAPLSDRRAAGVALTGRW